MDRMTASKVFITIVECGSMVKASESLDMSRSMVTRYLAAMEDWAKARLLHRSTRKLTLTHAGSEVLELCYKLQEVEQKVVIASELENETPVGHLRIASSQFFGENVLAAFVAKFLSTYPNVSIDMQIANQSVDLIGERVDLAIRITNGLDPNIIAKKFCQLHSILCCSRSYLDSILNPLKELENLKQLNCLNYSYFGNEIWSFHHQGEQKSMAITGNFTANDPAVLLQASLKGVGIAMLPKHLATPYIKNGQLIQVLEHFTPQTLGVYGIYKSREYMTKALRVFIDELAVYLARFDL